MTCGGGGASPGPLKLPMTHRADRRIIPLIPPGGPIWFPDEDAGRESGLLAAGGDLSPERLIYAYSRGIFPWYDQGSPILWWSPDPRCVLFLDELHVPRSLGKSLRRNGFAFSFDTAFETVIRHCAAAPRPGQRGTWLLPEMIEAYMTLHRLGVAHSVEVWAAGELAGGLYGVALGRVFFGESMFHTRPDASKAAVVALVRRMRERGFILLDCQQTTPHMVRLGAREIPRPEFLALVGRHAAAPPQNG